MHMAPDRRSILFLLFACSGFSGLIYESLWTHYLKLFLGHAAYAQVLVLAIFMAGLALGSWISSRYSGAWRNLLAGYALTELAIGAAALLFHPLFDSAVRISQERIIPSLGSPLAVTLYTWTLSALLILPQTILLGMTFPLMTAGFLRRFPEGSGRSLSLLYFSNSLGGAVGVMASGFALIRFFGLPGAGMLAGAVNLGVGAAAWQIARGGLIPDPSPASVQQSKGSGGDRRYPLLLAASCITGIASFFYEIGWTRMLSLVLGGSTHAFELMLAAFILGLAAGGFWVRSRIDRAADPVRMLAYVQVAMGALALLSLPLYGTTFPTMAWLVNALPKTDAGYLLFNMASGGLSLYLMFPAAFCAGTTLPLITHALLSRGAGEGSIGAVYAANTVGAIVGVVIAVQIALPVLDLKGLIMLGAGLDLALGIALAATGLENGRRTAAVAAAIAVAALLTVGGLVDLDGYKMGSGVYRFGSLVSPAEQQLVYHRDGKTATVSVFAAGTAVSIRTNGKTDAMAETDPNAPPSSDEPTMVLLGALPMAFRPDARTAANIGFGSGMTSALLLRNDRIASVDTIEIEPAMVEGARHFGALNAAVYRDPRSRIILEDARTYFTSSRNKYDIIVSEPSNPWVSGVASLFSAEFYRLLSRHLNEGGVFCQWLQLYEIDTNQVLSVLKALSASFDDFEIYAATMNDVIIIARNHAPLAGPDREFLESPALRPLLSRIDVNGPRDLALRRIGNKAFFRPLLDSFTGRENRDYDPVVDQNAARTRFLGSSATELITFGKRPLPLAELLFGSRRPEERGTVSPAEDYNISYEAYAAEVVRGFVMGGALRDDEEMLPEGMKADAEELVRRFRQDCRSGADDRILASYHTVGIGMTPFLTSREMADVWRRLEAGACFPVLSPKERGWIRLLKAIGNRDGRGMEESALAILEEDRDLPKEPLSYVVAAGMTGRLMQGKKQAASDLWGRYRSQLYGQDKPSLFFRYLVAASRE